MSNFFSEIIGFAADYAKFFLIAGKVAFFSWGIYIFILIRMAVTSVQEGDTIIRHLQTTLELTPTDPDFIYMLIIVIVALLFHIHMIYRHPIKMPLIYVASFFIGVFIDFFSWLAAVVGFVAIFIVITSGVILSLDETGPSYFFGRIGNSFFEFFKF